MRKTRKFSALLFFVLDGAGGACRCAAGAAVRDLLVGVLHLPSL
jgi:hypothetical protein